MDPEPGVEPASHSHDVTPVKRLGVPHRETSSLGSLLTSVCVEDIQSCLGQPCTLYISHDTSYALECLSFLSIAAVVLPF